MPVEKSLPIVRVQITTQSNQIIMKGCGFAWIERMSTEATTSNSLERVCIGSAALLYLSVKITNSTGTDNAAVVTVPGKQDIRESHSKSREHQLLAFGVRSEIVRTAKRTESAFENPNSEELENFETFSILSAGLDFIVLGLGIRFDDADSTVTFKNGVLDFED